MFDDLREDLRRFGTSPKQQVAGVVLNPGAWAMIVYRAARWLHAARPPRPLRSAANVAAHILPNAGVVTSSIQIPPEATIGPGLFLPHTGYVVMSKETCVGRHCTITQGVTLGHGAGGASSERLSPRIGNRVYIGPGAIVIGDVEVGNDALIGAGAVVVKNVPARAVVVGNPARIISYRGSFELISYPGMHDDSERNASLAARDRDEAPRARTV